MEFAIQVISSHPLVSRAVEKILSHAKDFPAHVLLPASRMVAATGALDSPRLFLLDGCSLPMDLGPLAVRCRVHSPGSKVLALLPPGDNVRAEEARLFSWGLDGFVELHETWQSELPRAILSILNGQLWVPPEVLLAFVKQAKTLLESQLLHGHFLTAREAQILQLLMRRSTNKEISSALSISERTVKFHVSNILSKLHIDDRRGLSADKFVLNILTSET